MQINRLFEMVYLLLNREKMTAGELAEHFEVSPRTVYRDVELLSSAGIPIYMTKGKGGGISLLSDFVLNKALLTDGEKSDILSALHAVTAVSPEQVGSAVQKLSSLFGTTNADWIEVDFSGWSDADEEAALFALLKTAILEKKKTAFYYHGSEGSTKRLVEPMKLFFKGQSWYLYAFCTLRQDYRFFKLRRIKRPELSGDHFERRAPARISSEIKVFQDDFVTLTLKLSKKMAYRVYDEFSQYELLPDGSFIAHLTIPRGVWVYHYLAAFGEDCQVLEPEDIRLQMKEVLQKTLDLYL